MMESRISAVAAALVLGFTPLSSAMVFDGGRIVAPSTAYDVETTGSINGRLGFERVCAPSSAAEGNANQKTRPVMQDGQTSGGTRC